MGRGGLRAGLRIPARRLEAQALLRPRVGRHRRGAAASRSAPGRARDADAHAEPDGLPAPAARPAGERARLLRRTRSAIRPRKRPCRTSPASRSRRCSSAGDHRLVDAVLHELRACGAGGGAQGRRGRVARGALRRPPARRGGERPGRVPVLVADGVVPDSPAILACSKEHYADPRSTRGNRHGAPRSRRSSTGSTTHEAGPNLLAAEVVEVGAGQRPRGRARRAMSARSTVRGAAGRPRVPHGRRARRRRRDRVSVYQVHGPSGTTAIRTSSTSCCRSGSRLGGIRASRPGSSASMAPRA